MTCHTPTTGFHPALHPIEAAADQTVRVELSLRRCTVVRPPAAKQRAMRRQGK